MITGAHLNEFLTNLNDSKVNVNSPLLGLKEFSVTRSYSAASHDGVIKDGVLYQTIVDHAPGVWNAAHFQAIIGVSTLWIAYVYVDGTNGNDSTGDGTFFKPYKTILKGLKSTPANGYCIAIKAAYQETPYQFSQNLVANNVTLIGMPGATIQGPDRTNPTYNTSFNGDNKFIYRVDAAYTFSIAGSFDVWGFFGLISTDNASAVVDIEVNSYVMSGVMGAMNMRFRNGVTRMRIKKGDLVMQDQQGLFIGPGAGSLHLNVLTGKIKMYKTNTGWVSNQTRLIQYRSTGNSYIECNGIESIVDGDHSYTEHLDPVFHDSTGKLTINLRGGFIKDTNFVNDGDYSKYAGQEGCLITSGNGNILLYGNIYSWYTSGIWTEGSGLAKVEVHGNIRVDNSSCIRSNNSNAGSLINIVGDMNTGPTAVANKERAAVHHLNSNRLFIRGFVGKNNLNENMPTIIHNGANLILDAGTKLTNNSTKTITTEVASRTLKLQDNIRMNQDISATPVAKVMKFTINKVRDSKIYSITINGTAYTYTSGVGATNLTIATGLTAAIGTPSGVSSVVDNGDGTVTVTATAGTNLTVVDSTTWATNYKWEIERSALDDNWRITINGTAFTFTSSDTTYYHETNGGVPDIRDNMKALIQANAGIDALIGTYQVDKFGLTLIANSGSVFDTIVGSGNSFGFVPIQHKAITVTTLEIGYLGGMINLISGTSFEYDSQIEAPALLND